MIVNKDRVVVVTGVSSGIGHGIATALVSHQCHVFGRCGSAFSLLRHRVSVYQNPAGGQLGAREGCIAQNCSDAQLSRAELCSCSGIRWRLQA